MRVAVAMSGGVDSLRTVTLLREQGIEVFGIHMRHRPTNGAGRPPGDSTECAVRQLAARLGIELFTIDLQEAFEAQVIRPFLATYRQGLTPNPCILCNPTIKFGLLWTAAHGLGAERMATGHYARIESGSNGRLQLLRGKDPAKDQSYFLYGLSQAQLARSVFPLGDRLKADVVRWAELSGFVLPEESQEICFIPPGDSYADFLRRWEPESAQAGPILDLNGKCLGEHSGLFAYTIGQRRGLGIASTAPYYVVALEPATNAVRIGRAQDLYRSALTVRQLNWVSIPPPGGRIEAAVRIRNLHWPARARITPLSPEAARIDFIEPQRAITPGQAAVFYDGDLVLGGGIIQPQR